MASPTISTDAVSTSNTPKNCGTCKKTTGSLPPCPKCNGILYCGEACQRLDWPVHKVLCKAFADTPSPDSSDNSYRRVIVFHPKQEKPKIYWVRPDEKNEWAMALVREILGMPDKTVQPYTEEIDCLNPHFIPHYPKADHHLFILLDAHKFEPNRLGCNSGVAKIMEKAGMPVDYTMGTWGFKGPVIVTRQEGEDKWAEYLIPGGPKLLNVDMEDFSDAVRFFLDYKGVNYNPTYEDHFLRDMAWARFCPPWLDKRFQQPRFPPGFREVYAQHVQDQLKKRWEDKQNGKPEEPMFPSKPFPDYITDPQL